MDVSAQFTTTLRRFNDEDPVLGNETFYTISGTTVVFNSALVDSISILPNMHLNAYAVRLNNHDGTCFDKHFLVTGDYVSEAPVPTKTSHHKARRSA